MYPTCGASVQHDTQDLHNAMWHVEQCFSYIVDAVQQNIWSVHSIHMAVYTQHTCQHVHCVHMPMYTKPLQVYTAYTTLLEHTTPQYPVSTLHNFTVGETYRKCLTDNERERVHI